jgi:hypothetical protein
MTITHCSLNFSPRFLQEINITEHTKPNQTNKNNKTKLEKVLNRQAEALQLNQPHHHMSTSIEHELDLDLHYALVLAQSSYILIMQRDVFNFLQIRFL